MAPVNLPGYLYPPQQQTGLLNQQPAQQQPSGFLGMDFSQANIPLALAGASMIGSNKRLGAAIPDAVKMYAMGQSLMNDKDEKEKERRKLQGMTQWYSQPKFVEQFGPEFGKLAQEFPQFAHEIYKDTLRPEGSRTGAVENWQTYNRILAEQGPQAAEQFKNDFVNKRSGGEKVFSGVQYGLDKDGNLVTGAQNNQGTIDYYDANQQRVQGPVTPVDPATMAARKKEETSRAELKKDFPLAKAKRDGALDGLSELARRAEEIKNHEGLPYATGVYSYFPSIRGGKAAEVEGKINTLKTQVFINVINAMREASKTGGAVGQVTEREMAKLEQAWASLEAAAGTPAYQKELDNLIYRAELAMKRINEQFDATYGGISVELPNSGQTSGDVPGGGNPLQLDFD